MSNLTPDQEKILKTWEDKLRDLNVSFDAPWFRAYEKQKIVANYKATFKNIKGRVEFYTYFRRTQPFVRKYVFIVCIFLLVLVYIIGRLLRLS